jgi:hypothetical protein
MAAVAVIGVATAFFASEPEKSAAAQAEHKAHSRENPFQRVMATTIGAFGDFLTRDMAIVILCFVILFKFTDAFAGVMIESTTHHMTEKSLTHRSAVATPASQGSGKLGKIKNDKSVSVQPTCCSRSRWAAI